MRNLKIKNYLPIGLSAKGFRFFADENEEVEEVGSEAVEENNKFDELLGDGESAYDDNEEDEEQDETSDQDDEQDQEADEQSGEEETQENDDEIDPSLIERAGKAGMTESQIKGFSTAKDLENVIDILEAQKGSEQQDEQEQEKQEEDEEYDCKLDRTLFEDALVDTINNLGKQFQSKIKEIEQKYSTLETGYQQQQAEEFDNWLDGQFNSLDEDFKEVFGEGDVKTVANKPDNFKNRSAVFAEMRALAAGYEATGQKVPSRDKLFELALNNKFGNIKQKAAANKTSKMLTGRAKQALGRSSRQPSNKKGVDEAVLLSEQFDKEHGL